jgi:hypothetical protein
MLLHGDAALRADKASMRLLADASPYSASECFELSAKGLLITAGHSRDQQMHFEPGGLTHIEAKKVQVCAWVLLCREHWRRAGGEIRKPNH